MKKEKSRVELIEYSLQKKYRKTIWQPFLSAIHQYNLIQPNDKIAVCISGGKDSMLLAKLFQMLQRYSEIPFEVKYIVMDPGYQKENRLLIEQNLKTLGIDAAIYETNIFASADAISEKPCYLCARMRRGHLYHLAQEEGCNKIALGHHFNDVIETALMSMFYSSKLETMIPKCHSKNFVGMELIRPLFRTKEDDIISWAHYNDLQFIQCACKFTERVANEQMVSKRKEIKNLIAQLKKDNPEVDDNIFRSLHRVQLETFPGYKKDGVLHSFLEDYDRLPKAEKQEEWHEHE